MLTRAGLSGEHHWPCWQVEAMEDKYKKAKLSEKSKEF